MSDKSESKAKQWFLEASGTVPTDDGGPAFPSQANVNDPRADGFLYLPGMTLRDWFAGLAMQAIISKSPHSRNDGLPPISKDNKFIGASKGAYQYADFMIAVKNGGVE